MSAAILKVSGSEAPIPLESGVRWVDQEGAYPYTFSVQFPTGVAVALFEEGNSRATLTLGGNEYTCFLLALAPSAIPELTAVELGDIRWPWGRTHVLKRYNVPRKSGTRRVVLEDQLGNVTPADDVEYHPETLKDGQPWRAREMIIDVLEEIRAQLPRELRFKISGRLERFDEETIEAIELDMSGPAALESLLARLPGAAIRLSDGNEIQLFSRFNRAESLALNGTPPPIYGRGGYITSNRRFVAPSSIICLFTREHEVRFDYTQSTSRTSAAGDLPDPELFPVMPFPDTDDEEIAPGTWVDLSDELFERWGDLPGWQPEGPLTEERIREIYLNGAMLSGVAQLGDLGAALDGRGTGINSEAALWSRRLAVIKQHYRLSYRMTREWVDACIDIRPQRVAILDFETGMRAPAMVYQDWAASLSTRALLKNAGSYANVGLYNVKGYAESLSEASPSPFTLDVLEKDLGIVRVNLTSDQTAYLEAVYPSQVEGGPTFNQEGIVPRLLDEIREAGAIPVSRLKEAHRAAAILTLIPAAPNSMKQLYAVEVKNPSNEALGPPLTIRIPAPLQTARFAWQDGRKSEILQVFRPASDQRPGPNLDDLLVNPEELRGIAEAYAKAEFERFANSPVGSWETYMSPYVRPDGLVQSVAHSVNPDGSLTTRINLLPEPVRRDPYALMPDAVRQAVYRVVQ